MWEMQALSTSQNQNLDPNNSDSSSPNNGIETDSSSAVDCLTSVLGTNGRCESDTNLNTTSHSNGGDTNVTTMQMDVGQTNLLGSNNSLIPSTGVTAALAGLASCNTVMALPNDSDTETVFVDAASGILHPALRGIKAVNIGSLPQLPIRLNKLRISSFSLLVFFCLVPHTKQVVWHESDRYWAYPDRV